MSAVYVGRCHGCGGTARGRGTRPARPVRFCEACNPTAATTELRDCPFAQAEREILRGQPYLRASQRLRDAVVWRARELARIPHGPNEWSQAA